MFMPFHENYEIQIESEVVLFLPMIVSLAIFVTSTVLLMILGTWVDIVKTSV